MLDWWNDPHHKQCMYRLLWDAFADSDVKGQLPPDTIAFPCPQWQPLGLLPLTLLKQRGWRSGLIIPGGLKLPHYNGEEPADTNLIQVQLVAQINAWTAEEVASHVALSLEGRALQLLTTSPENCLAQTPRNQPSMGLSN